MNVCIHKINHHGSDKTDQSTPSSVTKLQLMPLARAKGAERRGFAHNLIVVDVNNISNGPTQKSWPNADYNPLATLTPINQPPASTPAR